MKIKKVVLDVDIKELDFSVRTWNCLTRAQINTVKDIAQNFDNLHRVRNLGKRCYDEIVEKIEPFVEFEGKKPSKAGKIAWSKRIDDDIWRGGPCDSVLECVKEAEKEDYKESDTIALGVVEKYHVGYVNVDMIIEHMQQDAYDTVGEVAEDWLDNITIKQRRDLEGRVEDVVKEWLKEIGEEPTFYKVLPFDELTLKEAKEKYKAQSGKGGK